MPPKRKQTPRNAFYYFMVEFKERHGRQYRSLKEAADAAGPHWNKMNKEQRKPYENKALMAKNQLRPYKLTSDGQDVEEIERMERMEQERTQDMKDDINQNLKMANDVGRINTEKFFIIHINTFCHSSVRHRYYPAEIAIVCFSLDQGVKENTVFHKIINPGELPLGYASEAKLQSEETHQLPPPMAGDYEDNLEEVYTEMKDFLNSQFKGSTRFPPLYAPEKMMKMFQEILDTMCADFGEERPLFKVYNLQYMFKVLRNIAAGEIVWPNDTYSSREIDKDVYSYAPGICCEFHSVTDVPIYCSRSIAIRYAFIICDNCCRDLGIKLDYGSHVPFESSGGSGFDDTSSVSSFNSRISRSSKSSKLKQSVRDDDTDSVVSFTTNSEWDNCSVASDSTFTADSDYRPLRGMFGKKSVVSNSQPQFSSADSQSVSQFSGRSYAGAMGTSGLSKRPADVPSVVFRNFDGVSSNESETDFPLGRGRPYSSFSSNADDFPALGRGRAFGRGRRLN